LKQYTRVGASQGLAPPASLFPGWLGRGELDACRLPFDETQIFESVDCASYELGPARAPAVGETRPSIDRAGSYTWVKAPRYGGKPCEVGPLARAIVSGRDPGGRGVWARHLARHDEAALLCLHCLAWTALLFPGQNGLPSFAEAPYWGTASGLHDAPRGALGHWLSVENGKIARYNVISPTTWNGSPRDTSGQPGPIESALVGVPIADPGVAFQPLGIQDNSAGQRRVSLWVRSASGR